MKVLFVSSGNSHYGIIPFIKSQGESLIEKGINVHFFIVKGKGFKGYLKNIKRLKKEINNDNFDLIHAHYGLSGLVCVLSMPNIPIILSVMGSDAFGTFNQKGKRIKSSYVEMFLTQIALIFVDRIIVKSKIFFDIILYKRKCHIIPNGVNFDNFKTNEVEINKNSILFLANPNNLNKNMKLFDEAINFINRIDLKVIKPYPITHDQFPDYLNKASVFVLTSYSEGSPNVIKEAMACNIPIVSTNVGDVKEVIGNTEGCFIASFEPEDVAIKIQKALDFGKRTTGREDIKHLESSIIAKKIIRIYKSVLTN